MANAIEPLLSALRAVVGRRHVLVRDARMRPFVTGYRYGHGAAAAVVQPGSLVEFWRVLQACVRAGAVVICQAANTSLTGGATPDGEDYAGPVVVINTNRLGGVQLIDNGRQAVCLAGSTLYELEEALRPVSRDPHSVIGSSCIGASVVGGVCNNSGGAMVQRGPAFTQMALFAQLGEDGELHLVNHLGIDLGTAPEEMLERLDRHDYAAADIEIATDRWGSDHTYHQHVREAAATPARFNADPRRLFEASGCAGKLAVFAVRLDTFACPARTQTFYLGTNRADDFARLRRDMLGTFAALPVSAEYLHRDAFDLAARYGKDTFLAIRHLGTGRIPALYRLKSRYDAAFGRWLSSDRVLQMLSRLLPRHVPARLQDFRDRYEHHLILTVADAAIEETAAYLASTFKAPGTGYLVCSPDEAAKAQLHRFVVAGAAIRYQAVHPDEVGAIVALDVALPRNTPDWCVTLPVELRARLAAEIAYGHFFCHVFHLDYLVRWGEDADDVKARLLGMLARRGAEYPAEHNVGHLYEAKPALAAFYRSLDPANRLNPGIGKTSKRAGWGAS